MKLSAPLAAFSVCAFEVVYAAQRPFQLPSKSKGPLAAESYDASSLFVPLDDLSALSHSEYTTLGHPEFPHYDVRVKKSDFCDGGVSAYTGYIDIEARHLFFYFFESRSDPENDDVIFWTNGGPGCSSSMGLIMELGPCRLTTPNVTTYNPYSWNNKANIFFIDQPIGTGFSYADYGEFVDTTEEAAKDIAAFVAIFFEHFSKFKSNAFHMAGESYAGRLIPVFASEIYDQNAKLIEAGMTPINLSSIMIGNGCTDYVSMIPSYYDMQCKSISAEPRVPVASCVRQQIALPRCKKWLEEACRDVYDTMNCQAAYDFCQTEIGTPYLETGYNPYDVSQLCDGEYSETLCYPITKAISTFLDRLDVRSALGVDPAVAGNFTGCNYDVLFAFGARGDSLFPTQHYIAALLERGVRTLVYIGANDWVCNWVGNERMTLDILWTGQHWFSEAPLKEWMVDGQAAGLTRSYGPLAFATIYGGGHMAPYDRPKESLEMVNLWLAGKDL